VAAGRIIQHGGTRLEVYALDKEKQPKPQVSSGW